MNTIVKAAAVQVNPVLYSRQEEGAVDAPNPRPLHRLTVSSHKHGHIDWIPEGVHR